MLREFFDRLMLVMAFVLFGLAIASLNGGQYWMCLGLAVISGCCLGAIALSAELVD